MPGRHEVYDLTVEGAHEFYANGILVSNSDAEGYRVWYQRPSLHMKPVTGGRVAVA